MSKSVFPKIHNHKITNKKLNEYRQNLTQKEITFKPHHPVETFDAKQVLSLLSLEKVERLGIVQGADEKGQRLSILVAYDSQANIVGNALQTADPCPPPPCGVN